MVGGDGGVVSCSMLPAIDAVVSVEMIRDGGSLASTFIGNNGTKYSLCFNLIQAHAPSGNVIRIGFEKPLVFERVEFRDSHDGQETIGWRAINQTVVSWNHALILLHQIRGFTQDESNLKWLDVMEEVAANEGKLPTYLQIS